MKFSEYVYERPNIKELCDKVDTLSKEFDVAKNLDEAKNIVDSFLQITDLFQTMATICSIRNTINTADKFYEEEENFFNENSPIFQASVNRLQKKLVNSHFREELEKIYSKQWFKQMELSILSFDESIIPYLVEEAKLSTKYSKLIASAKIEFMGKIHNLSQMSVYQNNENREIRKAAELKKVEFMSQIEPEVDQIYDDLVHVRTKMAKAMGYDNYVPFGYIRLGRSDYNSSDVKKYRDAVLKEVVPVAKSIIDLQKKRINLPDLKCYDISIFYNSGNPYPHGNKDELVSKASKMYHELSKETDEFFNFMTSHELLDLETKPGKRGGGYCTYIPNYHSPFIFSNFNGTTGDVDVLTHEAGHAFEVYTASKLLKVSDIYWPTLEACEIHSMSMEFFAHPYMEYFFDKDASKYRYKHLAEAVTFIPYGVSVDEFQHIVYENPNLTPKERKEAWSKIEKKYTPWKDYDGISYYENGAYWQRQAHIFNSAFYYIDYTLAQVLAFKFFLLDLENHENAWKKYYDLCKLGGSKSFLDLLKSVDLPNPFADGTLKDIMQGIKEVLSKLLVNE